ncbi:MAG TPA: endopeptidase La [candidate division Zixibacteria bacterium]|nr:endopeptidase La [candidate division Zixibacteria bacterium]
MSDSLKNTAQSAEDLPILPLVQNVAFPGQIVPLVIQEEQHIKLIDDIVSEDKVMAMVPVLPNREDIGSFDSLFNYGVRASVMKLLRFPDGTLRVLARCIDRLRFVGRVKDTPYLVGRFRPVEEFRRPGDEESALVRTILAQFKEIAKLAPYLPDEIPIEAFDVDEPGRFADSIAAYLSVDPRIKQGILAEPDIMKRLKELQRIVSNELSVLRLSSEIQQEANESIRKGQREYMLREQMKAIRKELGDDDRPEIKEFRELLLKKALPEEAKKAAEAEIDRLERMNPASAEYTVSMTYIDWLMKLPWMESTEDNIDLDRAQRVLDEDHYGLEKIKERIVEFLAVRKLKPDAKSPILLFMGPPGVGKTSLGMSIARAMGRKFYRMSLGGMRDEAEIRGHRRTYVGALPGRIIQGIKRSESNNPVFMLDEIDKIGQDFRGDPASALLEVLDPEQNHAFADNYLEVPFDLSKVMFIATANYIDPIPRVLLDRMEMLRLPGYTNNEKLHIARQFLVPRQIDSHGLDRSQISFTDDAIRDIIDNYTREAGVRNLERTIADICRKVAKEIAGAERKRAVITENRVREYLGPDKFADAVLPVKMTAGMALGLAWTPTGGEVLVIEATAMPGRGNLVLTGHLGDVMKESAQTALSWVRSKAVEMGIDRDFTQLDIHLHVPAGAIPKDGPSAGIAMATCLASLMLDRPMRPKTAMTGEITLRGEVLPIGGLKEKALGANRAEITRVIVPRRNEKDLEELPPEIAKTMKFVFADTMDDVLKAAIG